MGWRSSRNYSRGSRELTRWIRSWCCLSVCVVFASCRQERETGPRFADKPPIANPPVYSLTIHPLYNPTKLIQAYQPLVDYVNQHLSDARLGLEASRDYGKFEEKYRARKPDFLLPNPWQAIQAMKVGYRVLAMAGEPADFKGIFVVRKDSDLKVPADLRGKAVSYPAPTALAACLMPQYFLHRHGVNVTTDIKNSYVGSQESAILNAYFGRSAAAATWPPPWRAFQKDYPSEAAELKVLWETDPLVNNPVMARDDVPEKLVARVQALLLELDGNEAGRVALASMETARFLPATDATYEVVRHYVARFEREVRPVEPMQ